MFSARRFTALFAQKVVDAYDAVLSIPSQYQPLAQDITKMNTGVRRKYSHFYVWRKLFAYFIGFLFVLAVFTVYSRGDGRFSTSSSAIGISRSRISKDQFVAAILREPVEGLTDLDPIRKKCNEIKFQDGLVWHCNTVVGGVGNVGNMWLNCVRYAMEAGATTLILPRLGLRSNNLVDLGSADQSVELSYLFDVPYFLDLWKQTCPQIRAVVSDSEVPSLPPPATSPHLAPDHVKKFQMRKYLIVDPTGWREAFDIWLAKNVAVDMMSPGKPVRVIQDLVLAQWNREAHMKEFANSFPRLFRYPVQTRRLAASALWALEKKIGHPAVADAIVLPSSPSASSTVNALGPDRLVSNGFLGVHMRVAADATAAGWAGYEAQAPAYVVEAKRLNLTTIYLATGSPEHREKFRADAAREGLNVIVKEDLLNEKGLAELHTLTWDQQALVDYDVLMHSTFLYGFVRSSFSWSLVLRRGTLQEAGIPRVTNVDEYRDNLSAVVGRKDDINPEGMWP